MSRSILNQISKDASIVILTGAGISAESGLETFRGAGGLWCGHKVEDVATPEAFARNPDIVHDFYNMRRSGLLDPNIQPNAAHKALARLEENWLGEITIVTQNIDDLHERGGSKNVRHMHGEVLKAFCTFCAQSTSNEHTDKIKIRNDLSINIECTTCRRTGGMRPDIVWFGEMPYFMDEIMDALANCDLFIAIGTSGHVYPAAGFVQQALFSGAYTLEFNLERSQNASVFHQSILGPAGQTLPKFVEELIEST